MSPMRITSYMYMYVNHPTHCDAVVYNRSLSQEHINSPRLMSEYINSTHKSSIIIILCYIKALPHTHIIYNTYMYMSITCTCIIMYYIIHVLHVLHTCYYM